jgi:hypothetical protein
VNRPADPHLRRTTAAASRRDELTSKSGSIRILGRPQIGLDGVTMTPGRYRPTDVCDQGIADKLGIPAAYLRNSDEMPGQSTPTAAADSGVHACQVREAPRPRLEHGTYRLECWSEGRRRGYGLGWVNRPGSV